MWSDGKDQVEQRKQKRLKRSKADLMTAGPFDGYLATPTMLLNLCTLLCELCRVEAKEVLV